MAENPQSLEPLKGMPKGEMERVFPSGDRADVFFHRGDHWCVVEVKTARASSEEQTRGVFQCKKNEALMKAEKHMQGIGGSTEVILVLGGAVHPDARAAANTLGVKVLERIGV